MKSEGGARLVGQRKIFDGKTKLAALALFARRKVVAYRLPLNPKKDN
jgi:hypothetical protein